MKQDDMSMYGKMVRIMRGLAAHSQRNPTNYDIATVSVLVELAGSDNFTDAHIIHLINFRPGLTVQVTEVSRNCQFHVMVGQVHMSTKDFALVATLDPRCPWVKI